MKNVSYLNKYFKIYLWQIMSFLLRFLSMFIVIPHLTKQPSIFGVYSLCISTTIFFNYADLGFLSASQKYATEAYARNQKELEIKYISFGAFVLLLMVIIFILIFAYFSYNPNIVIKNFSNISEKKIASTLFLLIAIFAPLNILNRITTSIIDIRLEGYKSQRINILQSLISITSVFYFFRKNHFEIVEYFTFNYILNILTIILLFSMIKKRYNYNLTLLFKSISFNKEIFSKTKKLAFSGLYVVFVWILYNELDQFIISKIYGIEKVALFAIAISILTLFRTIYSFIYSPFSARANYFVAENDDEGLKDFFINIIYLTGPIIFIPCITFCMFSYEFVISWVGPKFIESVNSVRFMSFVYSLSFLSFPVSIYLVAKEKVSDMYYVSTIMTVSYWIGIYFTHNYLDITSFALFKMLSTVFADIYYLYLIVKYFKLKISDTLKHILIPLLFFTLCVFVLHSFFIKFITPFKNYMNLFITMSFMALTIILTLSVALIISNDFRKRLFNIYNIL